MVQTSKPRLVVFLGAGGVGKTTLSASYAAYLSEQGLKVGLISIDPARRLQSAFGGSGITEEGSIIHESSSGGHLRGCMLELSSSLRRWIRAEGLGEDHEERLFAHPLFRTVTEKIASATETLAPVRMAEWLEQYPDTDYLIIDTAPGIHAVDFVIRPERLLAFLDSKILEWLQWFAGSGDNANWFQKMIRGGARGILQALGKVGGENLILSLGEMLLLLDKVFFRMVGRLQQARSWLSDPETEIYTVAALRDDAISVSRELSRLMAQENIQPDALLLNRALSYAMLTQKSNLESVVASTSEEQLLKQFVISMIEKQEQIQKSIAMNRDFKSVYTLPVMSNLENKSELRIQDLKDLGEALYVQLEPQ
ncbi:MAG: ArsA-related P-loop ATPase [Leptospiraceae bacterium]